jgi:phage terminase small subunit
LSLVPKHAAFVREYLVDLNATQAAIRAGFPAKAAASQASRLLRTAKVKAEIDKELSSRAQRVQVTADEVLRELKLIAQSDPGKLLNEKGYFLPINEMPEEIRRAIASVELTGDGGQKIKFWDKNTSLANLGKHLKLFTDKVELTGKDGEGLTINIVSLAGED